MYVTNENDCADDYEEVFYRPWYGLDIGCDCIDIDPYGVDLEGNENTILQGEACSGNHTAVGCRQVIP